MSLEFRRSLQAGMNERRARLLLGVFLPLFLLAATYGPYLILRSELPDRLATHFDFSGTPDGSMTVHGLLLTTSILIGLGLLFWVAIAGIRRPFPASLASTLGFGGGFLAGLGAGILISTVITQRDLTHWQEANLSWWVLLGTCGTAILAGALGAWIASFLPVTAEPELRAEDLPVMDLAPNQRAVWTATLYTNYLSYLGVGIFLAGIVLAVGTLWLPALFLAGTGFLLLAFSTVKVRIDQEGLQIKYGLLSWPRTSVDLEKIATASIIDVRPMQWGGWGYRGSLKLIRRAAVVHRAGPGIRLDLNDGRVFVVTVDHPEPGVALLNAEINRRAGESPEP